MRDKIIDVIAQKQQEANSTKVTISLAEFGMSKAHVYEELKYMMDERVISADFDDSNYGIKLNVY